MKTKALYLIVSLYLLSLCGQMNAAIWYVDSDAAPGGSGTSWTSPFDTIQEAINAANPFWTPCFAPNDQIYVKSGTYSLSSELTMSKTVTMYGGFPNGMTSPTLSDRNPDSYPSIIDGGDSVRCMMVTAFNVIDGFTFQNGRTTLNAGAMYIDYPRYDCGVSPDMVVTVRNCKFLNNYAGVHGGAIYDLGSDALIENCVFLNNEADSGGAIKQAGTSTTIRNCIFGNNQGTISGSGWIGGAITGDARYDAGLGHWVYTYGTITNCLFYGNTSAANGGAIGYHDSHPTITNCTFADNSAVGNGGAIFGNTANPVLKNCILWNNTPNQIYNEFSTPGTTATYCDIEDGFAGTGNINLNPQFIGGGDYHLNEVTSPCIDTGTNSGAPDDDLEENPRPQDGDGNGSAITDMGAYEFQPPNIDLVIDSIVLTPSSPMIGESVNITITVSNQGTTDSGPFWVAWYTGLASPPSVGDPAPEHAYVSNLAGGASTTTVDYYTYFTPGSHTMYALADQYDAVDETDETNNILGPQTVNVTDVDLVVNSITYNPTSPKVGEPVTITVTFSNQGTTDAGSFWVDWYADETSAPVAGDYGDRAQNFASLAAGASNTMVSTYTYTTEGDYITYAQIDTDEIVAETDEDNNIYGPRRIHAYDGELIDFNIIEDTSNASSWFGGDDGATKRNVGLGESMIFARDARVTSAGFRFNKRFDYAYNPEGIGHAVTLIMYVRESDGTLIYPGGLNLPASFNGGWAMFSFGTGLWFEAGQEYIFTCHLSNGDINEYYSGVYGRTDDPWPLCSGYVANVPSPSNMADWSNWGTHAWDFNFQMVGQYVEPYPGDLNDDRSVDLSDLAHWVQYLLTNDCIMLGWCDQTDINWNSDVQLDDFCTISRYWGNTYYDYEDLNRAAIVSMDAQMSTSVIDASPGNELNPGSYLIYRTNSGRYGKMIVESYGYDLTIGWVTYNSNGTVYTSGSGLIIHGTYLCDLDLGLETSTNDDFWWQVNSTPGEDYDFTPQNGAKFKLMYRAP